MPICHRTRPHWHLPTPLQAPGGERITIPVNRPSLITLVLSVALLGAVSVALSHAGFKHHPGITVAADAVCVVAAIAVQRVRPGWVTDSRTGLLCLGAVGSVMIWPGPSAAGDAGPAALVALGVVAAGTVAGEIAHRTATRRGRTCTGPASLTVVGGQQAAGA